MAAKGVVVTPYRHQDTADWQILAAALPGTRISPFFTWRWCDSGHGIHRYMKKTAATSSMGRTSCCLWMAHHLYMEQRNSYADKVVGLKERYDLPAPVVMEKND
jgi:hypothetical protein